MNAEQRKFIADELFKRVVQGAFQRAHIYENGRNRKVPKKVKEKFQNGLRAELEKLSRPYRRRYRKVSSDEHIQNIKKLADRISRKFSRCLKARRFRIGSAQKALNLYLKYLWCLDMIPAPPHCPFDNGIIKMVGGKKTVKWTELDDINEYRKLVTLARKAARVDRLSVAEWELRVYNNI